MVISDGQDFAAADSGLLRSPTVGACLYNCFLLKPFAFCTLHASVVHVGLVMASLIGTESLHPPSSDSSFETGMAKLKEPTRKRKPERRLVTFPVLSRQVFNARCSVVAGCIALKRGRKGWKAMVLRAQPRTSIL